MIKALLAFLLIFGLNDYSNSQSYYAIEIGNGGHALVTRDSEKQVLTATLLDFCEYQETLKPNFGPLLQDPIVSALHAIERIKEFDEGRYLYLQREIKSFLEEAEYTKTTLDRTSDHGTLLQTCKEGIEQAAIQKQDKHVIPYFFIDQNIWEMMPPEHQAGLVLHEVLFKDALRLDPSLKDSRDVRYFNAMLSANEFANENFDEGRYRDFLTYEIKMKKTIVDKGIAFLEDTVGTTEDGTITSGTVYANVIVPHTMGHQETMVPIYQLTPITFREDGTIDSAFINNHEELKVPLTQKCSYSLSYSTSSGAKSQAVRFDANGYLTEYHLPAGGTANLKVMTSDGRCAAFAVKSRLYNGYEKLRFTNGIVSSAFLNGSQPLPVFGSQVLFWGPITFHPTGFVASGRLAEDFFLKAAGELSVRKFKKGTKLVFNALGEVAKAQ
ncbi:MAG: hypothetical protein AB7T49_11135 [Oligoflexales bacterium]